MTSSEQIEIAESAAVKLFVGKPGILGVGAVREGDAFVIMINVERGISSNLVPAIPSEIEGVKIKVSRMNALSIINERSSKRRAAQR